MNNPTVSKSIMPLKKSQTQKTTHCTTSFYNRNREKEQWLPAARVEGKVDCKWAGGNFLDDGNVICHGYKMWYAIAIRVVTRRYSCVKANNSTLGSFLGDFIMSELCFKKVGISVYILHSSGTECLPSILKAVCSISSNARMCARAHTHTRHVTSSRPS